MLRQVGGRSSHPSENQVVRAAVRPENRRDCNFLGLCFHRSNYSPDAGKPLRSFPGWSFARQTRDGRINMRLGVHEIFCAVDKNMPRRDYRGVVAGDCFNKLFVLDLLDDAEFTLLLRPIMQPKMLPVVRFVAACRGVSKVSNQHTLLTYSTAGS